MDADLPWNRLKTDGTSPSSNSSLKSINGLLYSMNLFGKAFLIDGTTLVSDTRPGTASRAFSSLKRAGDKLYFNDGGLHLWESDDGTLHFSAYY